jgi:hypothetical protein
MRHNFKRRKFDEYIWQSFLEFLNTPGNHVDLDGGRCLKPDKEFRPLDTRSRSNRVCQQLWLGVLLRHLHYHNYN